jgi:phosphoribosylglycinamide formyltransferase 2
VKRILLLGSGELGKEFVIAAQRLGYYVIAVDRYKNAPAMQVAHESAVIDMQNAKALKRVVAKYYPDVIVPEVEAIHTETLLDFEKSKIQVAPSAKAAHLTMNRDAIRDLAAQKLNLRTARYAYAESYEELESAMDEIGYPCVIKPVMSSSGKGQSKVDNKKALKKAWEFAKKGRGHRVKVIVEEFINFTSEITLMTVKQKRGETLFCAPIGHVQESGDYRESWQPAAVSKGHLKIAQDMAKKVTDALGGAGIFGVEFFLTKNEVIFSELSPRPHDTGMVTLLSQNYNEFELHLRAIMGLPIRSIDLLGASASAVVLAKKEGTCEEIKGVEKALGIEGVDVRLFGKEQAYKGRRMAVTLARAKTVKMARARALGASKLMKVKMKS